MTDETLNKLCDKKIREALAKNPNEKRRVLTALYVAVAAALAKEQ